MSQRLCKPSSYLYPLNNCRLNNGLILDFHVLILEPVNAALYIKGEEDFMGAIKHREMLTLDF